MEKYNLPNLSQNLWKKYGFRANPFDTRPLTQNDNTYLPISEAIVGRDFNTKESTSITNILRNPGGARLMVTGNIGVGKTTFINYHRYLWENHAADKLFTTQNEIAIREEWRLPHFLLNILSSITNKLLCMYGEKKITQRKVFKDIFALSRVVFQNNLNLQASILGSGGGFGKSQQINIPLIPEVQLIQYLHESVFEIKKMGFAGLFLHIDNLELFSLKNSQKAKMFFEEIRDAIQIPDIYFVFVGKKGFFQEIISPLERVRSVFFGRPIVIPPLSIKQVLDAIHRRYQILQTNHRKVIHPIEDEFVEYLYNLYDGKLRYIMDSMNMILPEFASSKPYTIPTKEAQECLCNLVEEQIKTSLTSLEWKVFLFCVEAESFTNSLIKKEFKISGPNVTRLIKSLMDLDFVYLDKKEGRSLHYKVSEYTKIIKHKTDKSIRQTPILNKTHLKPKKGKISMRLKRAIKIIKKLKMISHSEYTALMEVSPATTTRDLSKLVKMELIYSVGNGKQKHYKLTNI